MRSLLLSRLTHRIRVAGVPVAGILVMASAGAYGQESVSGAGARAGVSIVPRVSITETLTDNVRLTNTAAQAEQITEISPGIRISGESGRLKGYFDYSLNEVVYAQNSSPSQLQHALTTAGSLEAVENWAFLDFSGSISQQAISAFGTQSIDNTSINTNRTEVSTYRLSPYVRGRLGGQTNYEARLSREVTSSDVAAVSGVATVDGMVKISGDSSFRNLGWSADASRQSVDYSAGRPTEVDRANLGLSYSITAQLNVFANAGREANNYTSFDKQSYGTSGFGVNWSTSERTRLTASLDHRSFGDAHSLSFEHRTARTAWKFSDTKDVSATPGQLGVIGLGTNYDFVTSLLGSTQAANLFFLQNPGVLPNQTAFIRVLASAVSLEHRQDLSFALLGVRDTVTFVATRSESSRLDTVATGILDDFTTSSLVHQHGFSVNYAHRLTPDYSLSVLALQQNTSGDTALQDTTLRLLNANVTGRVGKQATVSVGLRRVVSSGAAPYAENAIIGNLTVQF